jgi:hypothetical protein
MAMEGADLGEMLIPILAVLMMVVIFFSIGSLVFRKRFT